MTDTEGMPPADYDLLKFTKQIHSRPLPHENRFWHQDDVSCVKFTLDGELIASAGEEFNISENIVMLRMLYRCR